MVCVTSGVCVCVVSTPRQLAARVELSVCPRRGKRTKTFVPNKLFHLINIIISFIALGEPLNALFFAFIRIKKLPFNHLLHNCADSLAFLHTQQLHHFATLKWSLMSKEGGCFRKAAHVPSGGVQASRRACRR